MLRLRVRVNDDYSEYETNITIKERDRLENGNRDVLQII
jgi:hypothetical protein